MAGPVDEECHDDDTAFGSATTQRFLKLLVSFDFLRWVAIADRLSAGVCCSRAPVLFSVENTLLGHKIVRTSNFIILYLHSRGLALICMDSYDSESRRIFQHVSRSTIFAFLRTAPNYSEHLQNFVKNCVQIF